MRLVLFIQLMASIWLGVNWATDTAGSPGGQVVLSILTSILLYLSFILVDIIVMLPFNRRPVYVERQTYRPMTPAAREERRSEAIKAFRTLADQKREGSVPAAAGEPTIAQPAKAARHGDERHESFSERVSKVRPLSPPAE